MWSTYCTALILLLPHGYYGNELGKVEPIYQVVLVNTKATIQCHSEKRVKWIKDDNLLQTHPSNMLIIHSATQWDNGEYKCKGYNKGTAFTATADLYVAGKLKVNQRCRNSKGMFFCGQSCL